MLEPNENRGKQYISQIGVEMSQSIALHKQWIDGCKQSVFT